MSLNFVSVQSPVMVWIGRMYGLSRLLISAGLVDLFQSETALVHFLRAVLMSLLFIEFTCACVYLFFDLLPPPPHISGYLVLDSIKHSRFFETMSAYQVLTELVTFLKTCTMTKTDVGAVVGFRPLNVGGYQLGAV